jgi:hypothetical protein
MIAPAGKFDTVVAHLFNKWEEFIDGEVGPLASKEGNFSTHKCLSIGKFRYEWQ